MSPRRGRYNEPKKGEIVNYEVVGETRCELADENVTSDERYKVDPLGEITLRFCERTTVKIERSISIEPNLVVEWFHQVGTPLTTAFYFWHRRTDSNEETECQNEESKCLIELNVLGREIRRLPPDTSLNPSKLHQSLGSHITKHDMTFVLFALSMLMLIYPMPLLICFLC
ncbi:hypothetical protein EV361DRAFT_1034193 [Lentinula raphanica]|nr:hypothetical protein EV361DRAFT_1034193 [Lentinula raphanica]